MRRFIFVISLFAFSVCALSSAFALSDSEFLKMKKNPAFDKADKELNRIYSQAKKDLPKEKFERIKNFQREWLSERDEKARRIMKDEGCSKVEAYTKETKYRIVNLENEIYFVTCEGDYYSSNGVHLEVNWQNPLRFIFFAYLTCKGESWTGEGAYGDDEFFGVNEFSDTRAVIEFVDKNTVRIKTDEAFKDAVSFNADGIYKRR